MKLFISWQTKAYLRKTLPPFLIRSIRGILSIPRKMRVHKTEKRILETKNSISTTLLYAMRKTGSSTVHESLMRSPLVEEVYKTHHLSSTGIREAENYYGDWIPVTLMFSKMLHRNLDIIRDRQWKSISLVREPISRYISDLFQDMSNIHPYLIDSRGNILVDEVVRHLRDTFLNFDERTDYASTWFDKEVKEVFDIDVFAFPFDHENGFVIIHDAPVPLLIARLENLSMNFPRAISKFLGIDDSIKLVKTNIGVKKQYAEAYQAVLERLSLSKDICKKIYSSRYARHFYPEEKLNALTRKWTKAKF